MPEPRMDETQRNFNTPTIVVRANARQTGAFSRSTKKHRNFNRASVLSVDVKAG